MPTAPALCLRFAAFLICAASTQGSYSDDFAWHDVARWPCYNSKSRARKLAKGEPLRCGTLQAANASARAVLNHEVDGRAWRGNLSQCRRIRKTCATCLSLACAHYADCHCLLSSLCCLLVCAASTQGSSSDDFTWHAIAWRPCYNSKSRARELASNPLEGEPLCNGTL